RLVPSRRRQRSSPQRRHPRTARRPCLRPRRPRAAPRPPSFRLQPPSDLDQPLTRHAPRPVALVELVVQAAPPPRRASALGARPRRSTRRPCRPPLCARRRPTARPTTRQGRVSPCPQRPRARDQVGRRHRHRVEGRHERGHGAGRRQGGQAPSDTSDAATARVRVVRRAHGRARCLLDFRKLFCVGVQRAVGAGHAQPVRAQPAASVCARRRRRRSDCLLARPPLPPVLHVLRRSRGLGAGVPRAERQQGLVRRALAGDRGRRAAALGLGRVRDGARGEQEGVEGQGGEG
ncbi:uncharacterized protein RHOBADRAFT_55182, partial [Rhodotorula graminis WP1]